MKLRRLMTLLCVTGLCVLQPVGAQAQIIREPPPSAEEPGNATWREPYADPAQARDSGKTDLSGRISVGGQGGQDKAGDALYNLTSDSLVSLVQPLGNEALLLFDAAVMRKQSAVKEDQRYEGTLALDFERLKFQTSGGFTQTVNEAADIDSEDGDGRVGASVSSGLIETLPMSLEYQSVWKNREGESVEKESGRSDELAFKSVGTVGNVGLDVKGDLEYEDDREAQTERFGTAGNFNVTVPMREQLALLVNMRPIYNRNETETTELKSTSVESGLGVNWTPREDVESSLRAARVDAWSEGEGTTYDAYQNSWKGGLGVNYLPIQGFFAGPAYDFTKAVGGNASHDAVLLLGWRGKDILKELSGKGTTVFIRNESGGQIKDTFNWQFKTALVPVESMNLNGKYQGGYINEETGDSWNHEMGADLSHFPDPGLKYRGVATVSNTRKADDGSLWKQHYVAALTVKPLINYILFTFDVSETVDVKNADNGDDVLSAAMVKLGFPLSRDLSGRVGHTWEWINRTSVDGGAGNYFHYTAGLSLAGKTAPFSLNADYAVAHGYRGVRHDVSSGIEVPLRGGYALDGEFTLSSYEENDDNKLYWIFSLNLVYEF